MEGEKVYNNSLMKVSQTKLDSFQLVIRCSVFFFFYKFRGLDSWSAIYLFMYITTWMSDAT